MQKNANYIDIDPKIIDSYLQKSDKNIELSSVQQTNLLVNFSILDPSDPDIPYVQSLISNQSFSSLKESKAIALFIGSSYGDALGAHLEIFPYNPKGYGVTCFNDIKNLNVNRCPEGQWTDDTAEALCLADSLLINDLKFDPIDIRSRFVHWWFSGYNNGRKNQKDCNQLSIGIGSYTMNGLFQFLCDRKHFVESPEKTNSNGSIMRVSPIPIAFHSDLNAGLDFAGKQSYCTHNGDEASECCKLLTWLAIKGLNHPDKGHKVAKEILDEMGKEFKSELISIKCLAQSQKEQDFTPYINSKVDSNIEDRNWDWKNPNFDYAPYRIKIKPNLTGIYCMDCVAMALHIIYHNEGFNNCVLKAVNLGGDADSVGGVTGMLCGAFYGFNEEIKENYKYIQKWDENAISIKAYKLLNLRK